MQAGVSLDLPSPYTLCKLGGMTLTEYIREHGTTAAALAEKVGVSAASMTRIGKGRQNITLDLAQRIVDATGGMVGFDDLAAKRAA